MSNLSIKNNTKPILRWAGGKQKLAPKLATFAPDVNKYNRYYEPFFGGGAVFFKLDPHKAILGDINSELVNCYRQIQKNYEEVFEKLRRYVQRNDRSFYYRVRNRSTTSMSASGRAALFIYLNKTAFNGIYRVNTKGQFNVPYGPSKNGPAIPSKDHLSDVAKAFSGKIFRKGDFETIVNDATEGDFVYLDPPYPPRNSTGYFTHYTPNRFTWEDQERVAEVFNQLSNRSCKVMLSNSGQKKVINLYQDFHVRRLSVTRWLGSNGDRFKVHEIVVTNYNIDTGELDV